MKRNWIPAAAGLLAIAAAAPGGPRPSGRPPAGHHAVYSFEGQPRYQALGLIIRNPNKVAPLLACGYNTAGQIAIRMPRKDLDLLASEKKLDEGKMEASGSFTGEIATYGAPRFAKVDPNKYACAEWLGREEKPKIVVKLDSITDWKEGRDRSGKPDPDRFAVKLAGSITVDGTNVLPIDTTGRVSLSAPRRPGNPYGLRLTFEITVRGAALGLGGQDAGELSLTCSTSSSCQITRQVTKKVTEELREKAGKGLDLLGDPLKDEEELLP